MMNKSKLRRVAFLLPLLLLLVLIAGSIQFARGFASLASLTRQWSRTCLFMDEPENSSSTSLRDTERSTLDFRQGSNGISISTCPCDSRRSILRRGFLVSASVVLTGMSLLHTSLPVDATETDTTIWITGRAPKVPGQKPRDKSDLSGTKKDPNFLRSISDCKNQCENSAGRDGYARSKEDCLSDCQDICCTTYEQCTFAIVPRI